MKNNEVFLQHFPFGNFAKVYYHNILLKEIQTTLFALSRRGKAEIFYPKFWEIKKNILAAFL
jgi:hypothetical protein